MKDKSFQTDFVIEYINKGNDCIQYSSKTVQTESLRKVDEKYLANVQISYEIIDLIIETLKDAKFEEKFFYELDEYKKTEKVNLIEFRTATIPMVLILFKIL